MIASSFTWLRDTLGGVYELVRLALLTRLRFRSTYWRWRFTTVFGKGVPDSRRELVTHALRYGRWVHRLRRWSR